MKRSRKYEINYHSPVYIFPFSRTFGFDFPLVFLSFPVRAMQRWRKTASKRHPGNTLDRKRIYSKTSNINNLTTSMTIKKYKYITPEMNLHYKKQYQYFNDYRV